MNVYNFQTFESRSELQTHAAQWIEQRLRDALMRRGSASFLGSGGSTPGPVYDLLSRAELDWARIWVGLTDERWVGTDHPASNEAMIRRTLLQNEAAIAEFTGMKTPAPDPFAAIDTLAPLYQEAMLGDIVLVGMGPDAHTLSWFARADGLSAALDPDTVSSVAAIRAPQSEVTGPHTERMTLTLPCIAYARHVLLLITGKDKKAAFQTAQSDTPIQHLIRAAVDALSVFYAD